MWLPRSVIDAVDKVAHVKRVSSVDTKRWNKQRRPGELVAYCGWYWEAKKGRFYRQNFASKGGAYLNCYHDLVLHDAAPLVDKPRLKVVKSASRGLKAAA